VEINREWAQHILAIITEDPEVFYSKFLPAHTLEPAGANLRIQPCPKCGHHDCCTITPGVMAVNCFSPGCISGNHLKFIFEVLGFSAELAQAIGEFYNHPYVEDIQLNAKNRLFEIRDIAAKFYHKQFMENDNALTYQVQVRKHNIDTLRLFQIGYSSNFSILRESLYILGYVEDEIKEAAVWLPEGLIVYPIIDFSNKKVYRLTTKNPFGVTYKDKPIKAFSTGFKTSMMTTPSLNFESVILVEGENDLISIFENTPSASVMAMCGKLSKEQIEVLGSVLSKFDKVYCMFDNDDAGAEYENTINESLPHLNIFHCSYGTNFKDPDEAFKSGNMEITLTDILAQATLLETKGYNVSHRLNVWTIENRVQKLEFEILDKTRNGSLVGALKYYESNELKDIQYDITLAKSKFKPLNFYLLEAMGKFFNENLEDKSLDELIHIYYHTRWKGEVLKILAKILFNMEETEREPVVILLRRGLGEEITDIILKELNELQNEDIVEYSTIPRMKLGQFFSVRNKEAFMYFTYVKKDGDTIRKLPYLLTSDRKLIRLDLYKRKDEQCLILIRNKYELPMEVPQAIMDLQRISLSQSFVEEYVSGNMDPKELSPKLLMRRIENFLRKFYYHEDENIFKVLSIWIYGTYCYELFGQYPYLFLNGPKGSGKTVLDVCIDLLAFNPKMTVSITNAALFRSISVEGGTLILDEMENLTSRKQAQESDLAAILKGGYMRAGCAMRCDKDNGNMPQMFDVFGPKVVSNIFGLEDIISDRCIQLNTAYVRGKDSSKILRKLEDPKQFYIDGLGLVKELTSKCALSILEHFLTIYKVYKEYVFDSANARLAQIMRPIQALAFLAGPDFEKALANYYNSTIKVVKEEIEYETPEGALEDILRDIGAEIMGEKESNYISANLHKYKTPVKISYEEGWFEIDAVHIKTFMEEVIGRKVDNRNINTWVRRVAPVDMYSRKRRTTVSLEDPALVEEYNGNTRLKVHVYKFYLVDFFPEADVAEFITKNAGASTEVNFSDL